jgi:hypothetical protein
MLILTAEDMLRKGLELGGFDRDRQKKVRRAQNLERFKALQRVLALDLRLSDTVTHLVSRCAFFLLRCT